MWQLAAPLPVRQIGILGASSVFSFFRWQEDSDELSGDVDAIDDIGVVPSSRFTFEFPFEK